VQYSAVAHRQPLCTMLFPRSPGFDSPPFAWSDACRNALFAGARTVQRLPAPGCLASPLVVQISGMAVLPQRAAQPRKITRPYANS